MSGEEKVLYISRIARIARVPYVEAELVLAAVKEVAAQDLAHVGAAEVMNFVSMNVTNVKKQRGRRFISATVGVDMTKAFNRKLKNE